MVRSLLVASLLAVALVAAVGVAAWAAVFAYFAATGRLGIFYDTIFKYAGYYAQSRGGTFLTNILGGLIYEFLARAMKSTPVLIVLAAAGAIYGLVKGPRTNWLLLIGFLFGVLGRHTDRRYCIDNILLCHGMAREIQQAG